MRKTENKNIVVSENQSLSLECNLLGVQPRLQKNKTPIVNSVGVFAFISFGERHIRSMTKEDRRLWIFFSSLKNVFGMQVGITQEDLKLVCGNKLPYKYETARKLMTELVKEDYAIKSLDGYRLRSIKKVAREKFDVPSRFEYTYMKGKTKKEVLARVSYCIFKSNTTRQHFKQSDKRLSSSAYKKSGISSYKSGLLTVGVRWVSKLMGASSAMIGSKIEKEWERLGLVKIKRSLSLVCSSFDLRNYLMSHPEEKCRVFLQGNNVYRRDLNKIICLV